MAEDTKKPLPRGGDGSAKPTLESIVKFQQNIYGHLGQNTLKYKDLTEKIEQGNDKQIDLLVDISESLGILTHDLVPPITNYVKELLENGPAPAAAAVPPGGVVGAAPGAAGEGVKAEGEEAAKQGKKLGSAFRSNSALGGKFAATMFEVGLGLGAVGLGLATITGALYLGAKAVEVFGKGLSSIAVGLEDLMYVDVETEKFVQIGDALVAMTGRLGIGGSASLLLIAQSDFENLARGIKSLSELEFNREGLDATADGLASFLERFSTAQALIGGTIAAMVDDNLIPLADGVTALSGASSSLPGDFAEKMSNAGLGVNNFLQGFSEVGLGTAITGAMLDDNLIPLAGGVQALGEAAPSIQADFAEKMGIAGQGLRAFMDGMDLGLFGSFFGSGAGLQAIDDNLVPLAAGLDALNAVPLGSDFVNKMTFAGQGLQHLLDGTDDVFGVLGAMALETKSFDDLKYGIETLGGMDAAKVTAFNQYGRLVGDGFQKMFDGTDDVFGVLGAMALETKTFDDLKYGVETFGGMPKELVEGFKNNSRFINRGYEDLLDGTDDLFGVLGAMALETKTFDDLAHGVRVLGTNLPAEDFADNAESIGEGYKDLLKELSRVDVKGLENLELIGSYTADLMGETGIQTLGQAITDMKGAADLLTDGNFAGADQFSNFRSFIDLMSQAGAIPVGRIRQINDQLERLNTVTGTVQDQQQTQPSVSSSNVDASTITNVSTVNRITETSTPIMPPVMSNRNVYL